jgi:hypothetical protein
MYLRISMLLDFVLEPSCTFHMMFQKVSEFFCHEKHVLLYDVTMQVIIYVLCCSFHCHAVAWLLGCLFCVETSFIDCRWQTMANSQKIRHFKPLYPLLKHHGFVILHKSAKSVCEKSATTVHHGRYLTTLALRLLGMLPCIFLENCLKKSACYYTTNKLKLKHSRIWE